MNKTTNALGGNIELLNHRAAAWDTVNAYAQAHAKKLEGHPAHTAARVVASAINKQAIEAGMDVAAARNDKARKDAEAFAAALVTDADPVTGKPVTEGAA